MYKFEKLKVWNESMVLIERSYEIIKQFPVHERNGLADQLRRASTSISLNIAEGSGSGSDKEFTRYLYMSRKSLFEVIAILKIVERLYNIKSSQLTNQIDTVGKLINGLIKSLRANS